MFKERVNYFQATGCILALAGLVSIIINSGSGGPLIGVILALAGAISWSFCNIIINKYKPVDMSSFVTWSCFYATITLAIIAFVASGMRIADSLASDLSVPAVASLISQSYLTTVFGYWAWNSLVKKYSPATIAPLSLMVPVCAIIVGVLDFGEKLRSWELFATILIIFGVSLFTLSGRLVALMKAVRTER